MTNSYPSGSPGVPESSMPTGAPGLMPRRSSYASVVSGTASAMSQSYQQPTRSGALAHLLNETNDFTHEPPYPGFGGNTRHDYRGYDMDFNTNGGNHAHSGSWGRGGQLPSFSSAFGPLMAGSGYGGLGGGPAEQFFIPSYLKRSRYVRRLEEAHKAKYSTHRDGQSPGSLSTSTSSINLQTKMAPSHRGMTYEIIEKASPIENISLPPLPTKWNSQDKNAALEVFSEGLEVKFTGMKSTTDRDHEASSIRADQYMPPQCGIYYFEVTILSRKREESSIAIGFCGKSVPLSRIPGWEPDSWAYHGDDGNTYSSQTNGKAYGPPFSAGDIIGCGINFRTGSAFFTKNGDSLGTAFHNIKGRYFPSVGMKKTGEHVRMESQTITNEIKDTSTEDLAPPLNETELIQSLVLQFLTHDGYVETARAFAEELHSEKKALSLDPHAVIHGCDIKEDEDAAHRQRIRTAVLDGDVDKALKYTNAYYPSVLKDNEHVYFRLRCRKFIEMIRQGADILDSTATHILRKSNGHSGDWDEDISNNDMELDDRHSENNWADKMDTEESLEQRVQYDALVNDTIAYGRILQAEFENDPRREVGQALTEAFALIAYTNPSSAKEVAHLLDPSQRVAVAEELNSAILLSLGKSSSAALDRLHRQTTVLLEELTSDSGPASFVDIDDVLWETNPHIS
ncbi:hypothetical protein B7494_g3622 [Chlorociboria aeruginascens]|nr:hypothetical protein B7494_g3622 [Chlorociboria aeruginascens]